MEHLDKRLETLERNTTHSRFVFGISIIILAGILSVLGPLVIRSAPSKFTGPSEDGFTAPTGKVAPSQHVNRTASSTTTTTVTSTTTTP